MDLIKVEGHNGLMRDRNTGAILNINSNEIDRIKELRQKQREAKASQEQEIKVTPVCVCAHGLHPRSRRHR